MKYVVIDLEMNNTAGDAGVIKHEIIEIGAVVLDENYTAITEFVTYVKPEFNSVIEKKITKLTGITTKMVENAPSFAAAFKMFSSFCRSLGEDVSVYAWSDSDRKQIICEMEAKHYVPDEFERALVDNVYDFQKEFDDMLKLERQVSLKNALFYAGIEFDGREHDALFDARNTAELLSVARIDEKRKQFLDRTIEYLSPKECTSSLGDLFDFSKFSFAS